MTVEEQSASGKNLNEIVSILDCLPISRAALKKSESMIDCTDSESSEKKVVDCIKDENLIIDLNDNLAEAEDVTKIKKDMDQEVPVSNSSYILTATSPVSLLMEYSQRDLNGPTVIWNEYSHSGLFGCRVDFGDKFWIVPAQYSRKKEARSMVALMACTELIDRKILFDNVELKKYESWTKDSVRKMSDELAEKYICSEVDPVTIKNSTSNYCQNQESVIIKLDSPSNSATRDESVSYVALVNEACQKLQINSPDYKLSQEKLGSNNLKFSCSVEKFSGSPDICSDSLPSKRLAKNDAAKKIYEHMQMNGKIYSAFKPAKQNSSMRKESSDEIISVIKNLLFCSPDDPIDPTKLIPLVMSLLTHISQSIYPEKNTLDGIYEMIYQWNFFLDWKKENNQSISE